MCICNKAVKLKHPGVYLYICLTGINQFIMGPSGLSIINGFKWAMKLMSKINGLGKEVECLKSMAGP